MKWIKVEDQLPESEEKVIAIDENRVRSMQFAMRQKDSTFFVGYDTGKPMPIVTHWMQKPEWPKE